jgi:hypothetical protein
VKQAVELVLSAALAVYFDRPLPMIQRQLRSTRQVNGNFGKEN